MEEGLKSEQYKFPIWLVGDSYPGDLVDCLRGPLDPRHPTRHTIWTPIWDAIQETVYPRRVDGRHLFVCNAAEKQAKGERPNENWTEVTHRLNKFSKYLCDYKPAMVICFGAWAFEFARRAHDPAAERQTRKSWSYRAHGRSVP